jgi:hypothetical protein
MDNSESPSPINEMTSVKPLSPKIEQFANLDPGHEEINVNCPSDKEFNPFTKRCVKKCKTEYTRNPQFKCQKTRKLTNKLCPEDKELNPFTKRCVKKCKTGYTRNEKFVCQKK